MHNLFRMKSISIIAILLVPLALFSKNDSTTHSSGLPSVKNHIELSVGFTLGNSISERISGDAKIKSPLTLGFNYIGFGYLVNFNKKFSGKLGLNIGFQSFGFNGSYFRIDNELDYFRNRDYVLSIEFPYHLVYKFNLNRRILMYFEAGINFRGYQKLTSVITSSYWDPVKNDLIEFYSKTEYGTVNLNITYSLNGGILIELKNTKMIKVGLLSNIGHFRVVEGKYYYYENNTTIAEGRYLSNGTYFGICIGYIFTNVRIKK